jgi:hypothetical protein
MPSSASLAGTGLGDIGFGRGRSWTGPPSPTPLSSGRFPDDDKALPATPRTAEVRYSGGNLSHPMSLSASSSTITPIAASAEPPLPKTPQSLRKPTPRVLQPLTLPVFVAAGGRLSPRVGGTCALPSSPSLIA